MIILDLVLALLSLTVIYYLPGYILGFIFTGSLRKNIFFSLFLSLIAVPFIYLFLAYFDRLSLVNWLVFLSLLCLTMKFLSSRFVKELIDTDQVFGEQKVVEREPPWLKKAFYLVVGGFFFLVMIGKVGLPFDFMPVGDHKPQMQKVTAVALSPKLPLFYNYPISELTIYYFNNIPAGLMTKFTANFVRVNQSWFIHSTIATMVMLWLVVLLAKGQFGTWLQRLVLVFSVTWVSGLEFYLAALKGQWSPHLEWWTDWIGFSPMLHTQISALFTLFYWVPQHLFGALLVIPLYFLITSRERKKLATLLFIALLLAAMVGYTVFVFITVAIVYTLYFLVRLVLKKEKSQPVIRENLLIGLAGGALALPMILLYAGAQKSSWFVVYANNFWFLPNDVFLFKIINIFLTALIFFAVELGPLLVTLAAGFVLFIKQKRFQDRFLFWGLFLYAPLGVIFVVKALDDNNISMRALIPTQIALAVVSAWVIGWAWQKWAKTKFRIYLILGLWLFFLLPLPTTLYEGVARVQSSFIHPDPIYKMIDQHLPVNSIILNTTRTDDDFIATLGHRFTFKPIVKYNVTDKEYVALGKIAPYNLDQTDRPHWERLFWQKPEIRKNYHLYVLYDVDPEEPLPSALLKSEKLMITAYDSP